MAKRLLLPAAQDSLDAARRWTLHVVLVPMNEPTHADPRLIKRYANRKLYDTQSSSYVTLNEIAEFIRNGDEVSIVDNNSKEDLTNVTLAQIIYEEEKKSTAEPRRSRNLRDLIQQGRDTLKYLRENPIAKLVTSPDGGESSPTGGEHTGEGTKTERGLHIKQLAANSAREAWEEVQRAADARMRPVIESATGYVQQLQSEVDRLKSRIDDLETKLSDAARKATHREPKND